jgi:hypothetical protein
MIPPIPKLSNYPHGNGRHVLAICVRSRVLSLRPGWYSDGIGMQRGVRKKSLYPGDTSDMNLTPESGLAVDRPRPRCTGERGAGYHWDERGKPRWNTSDRGPAQIELPAFRLCRRRVVSAYESVADQSGVFLRFLRVGGGLVFCMGPVLALRMAGRGRLDTSRLASRAAYPATSRLEQPPVVASAPSCFSASACRVERDRGAFHYVREQRVRPR